MGKWEAAIMIKDKVNMSLSEDDRVRKGYFRGDVVEVLPAGSDWGTSTVKEFLIVSLGEMTREEAMKFKESVVISDIDDNENEITELVSRCRYNINIDEMDEAISMSGKRAEIEDPATEIQPFKTRKFRIDDKEPRLNYRKQYVKQLVEGRLH